MLAASLDKGAEGLVQCAAERMVEHKFTGKKFQDPLGKETRFGNGEVLGKKVQIGCSGKHPSRMGAMDTAHHVGPSALGENAGFCLGPSAPGRNHGSQSGTKSTIGWSSSREEEKIDFLEKTIAAVGYAES